MFKKYGLTPRADERIIREIGGESAVRGFGIQQKIDEYKSAKENLKNLNEQLNDPSSTLFSEDQDSLLASIEFCFLISIFSLSLNLFNTNSYLFV